ncbi:MAG: hypothetical protein V3V57_05315 [Spirochaetia bacterium]
MPQLRRLISTDGYKNEDIFFELFLKTLNNLQVKPAEIAGVITESCQGVGQSPAGYRGGGEPEDHPAGEAGEARR